MVRKRKEKEARKEVQSDASDSDDDDNNNVAYSNQIQKKQRHGKRNRVSGQYRATIVEANATAGVTITSQAEHKVLPFCCSNCTCDEAYREEASVHDGADLITPDASGTKLSHLKCCHGLARRAGEFQEDYEKRLGDWAPPILSAQASTEQKLDNGDIESLFQLNNTLEWITKRELAQAYKNAKRAEATFYNDDSEAHALDILCTNPNYIPKVKAPFDDRIRRIESGREQRRKATVLDCFAGVGTAELVLKRLGIDIQTVIYVEHDRVARHVYRSNHDPGYFNQEVTDPLKRLEEDNIEHVYEYSDFESLVYDKNNNQNNDNHNNNNNNEEEEERESTAKSVSDQKVKDFLKLHGPIDIVLGGPPCIEFSTVNAYRKGINSKQGNYMVAFGELIRKIELFQDSPIYFLVENVVTKDEDLDGIRKAFQMDWDPITLDSQYFSPARRKRQFWTNIPLSDIEYNTDLSHIGPDSCLEQGFYLLAHIVDKKTTAKCNCLMGSAERMDERSTLRMYVFQDQPKGGKYCGRPLTVSEREHLMGYPPGYVETPGRLFWGGGIQFVWFSMYVCLIYVFSDVCLVGWGFVGWGFVGSVNSQRALYNLA